MLHLARSLTLLSAALFLAACSSSTPSAEDLDEQAAESTDACLADPAAAKEWGECNVKAALFSQRESIAKCQAQHSKAPSNQTMILKIQLKADGAVRNVRAEEGGPKNRSLEKCLRRVVRKIRFAAPPAGVKPVIYFPTQM
jgi:hypothetical protein